MSDTLKQLTHDQIHPGNNVRHEFDNLDELEDSLVGLGQQQAILVRRNADGFELIAGERRWRAFGRAIAKKRLPADHPILAIVRTGVDEAHATAGMLVENLHRADLTPAEEYGGIVRLANEHNWSVKEISTATGISQSVIKDRLSWTKLPAEHLETLLSIHGVTMVTAFAGCDPDTITKVCKSKSIGDEMRKAVERKAKEERARTLTNHLRKIGHLVIRSMDDLTNPKFTNERALFDSYAEQAKANGGEVQDRYVFGTVTEDFSIDKFPPEPQLLFLVSVDLWNVNVKHFKVHTDALGIGRGVDGGVGPSSEPRNRRQFDIDRDAAHAKWREAQTEWREKKEAAKAELVQTGKASELIALVLKSLIYEIEDEAAHEFHLVEPPTIPGDLGISVGEFADKGATQLARAAAAYCLYYQHEDVPGFPPQPAYEGPNPNHYDASTGKKLSAAKIAAADEAQREQAAADKLQQWRDERVNDLTQPLQREDFETQEEYDTVLAMRAAMTEQDADAEAVEAEVASTVDPPIDES